MKTDIRELSEMAELDEVAELFAVVWGQPGQAMINSDTLRALQHSGNYIAAAFVDGRMAGGLVGWLGGRPPDALLMHSHILGVLPNIQAQGLGFDLKQHQRRWCLARGVRVMEWTTDPLIRRNVYFNLAKLGAQAPEYLVNFYGAMHDQFNAGDESDRLLIRWRLDSQRAEDAALDALPELDVERLLGWGASRALAIGSSGEPVVTPSRSRVLLCRMPDDIVALRHGDRALAHEWRLALRMALGDALARGYGISGATRSGWYVLESGTE